MSEHQQQSTLSEKNQTFFDSLAISTNRPQWMQDLVSQIQTEVLARRDWIGIPKPDDHNPTLNKPRLLDYACGSGELSLTLLPSLSSATGIDISPAMVSAYNSLALTSSIPSEKMHAIQGDLLSPLPPSSTSNPSTTPFADPQYSNFDIAILSMALHHVFSPPSAIAALVSRLRAGGTLVVIDWVLSSITTSSDLHPAFKPGDHGEHAHNPVPGSEHTITRAGFEREEMEKMFADAGCEDVGFVEFGEGTRLGDGEGAVVQRLFMVRGRKKRGE
ncbi:MAG: hypothetical protein Q9184_003963 [Pyrenodesmia sp. 2 TL-2023]